MYKERMDQLMHHGKKVLANEIFYLEEASENLTAEIMVLELKVKKLEKENSDLKEQVGFLNWLLSIWKNLYVRTLK